MSFFRDSEMLRYVLILNGIWDIWCGVFVLKYPDTFFGRLHMDTLYNRVEVDDESRELLGYCIVSYGIVRLLTGLNMDNVYLYILCMITYFLEFYVYYIEYHVKRRTDNKNAVFVYASSMIILMWMKTIYFY